MAPATLPVLDFSDAKARLSDVMTAVTQQHQPRLVQRHHGKESMVLVDAGDLAGFLAAYRFEPTVVADAGELTMELEHLGILGFGTTMDEAIADLVSELRAYSQRYFAQPAFYAYTDRRGHWPWLLRFALTDEDRQGDLILADMKEMAERRYREMQPGQQGVAGAAAAVR
jgi:hypothetical protein